MLDHHTTHNKNLHQGLEIEPCDEEKSKYCEIPNSLLGFERPIESVRNIQVQMLSATVLQISHNQYPVPSNARLTNPSIYNLTPKSSKRYL